MGNIFFIYDGLVYWNVRLKIVTEVDQFEARDRSGLEPGPPGLLSDRRPERN